MTAAFVTIAGAYVVLTAVRFALTLSWFRRRPAPCVTADASADVTVLQPILSGDPTLAATLAANQAAHPKARFLLLVDDDDPEGQRIAAPLSRSAATSVAVGPPPRPGENPKVAKLARAFPLVSTPFFAVLDDDTVLPAGALTEAISALEGGAHLATGLPWYNPTGNIWSGLLAAFVNGSALITYPAASAAHRQRTINGMFYLGRTDELRALGGFDRMRGELIDDYAMAKLYLDAGHRIVQTAIVHPISTTVTGPAHYARMMRRWMIFGLRYMRENRSVFTLGIIGGPTLLPPLMLVAGLLAGPTTLAAALTVLAVKTLATAWLHAAVHNRAPSPADAALQLVADVLTPFHLAAALIRPDRLTWRSRSIRLTEGRIEYE